MRRLLIALVVLVCCGISAVAAEMSIHSMVVGQRALALSETRQLTYGSDGEVMEAWMSPNGKYVAYSVKKDGATGIGLVKATGGEATLVLKGSDTPGIWDFLNQQERDSSGECWMIDSDRVTWSPDSKHFAFSATRYQWTEKDLSRQNFILVLASNGAHEASFPIADLDEYYDCFAFSPDSEKIATVMSTVAPTGNGDWVSTWEAAVFNLASKEKQAPYSQTGGGLRFEGWGDGGESVVCVSNQREGSPRRIKAWLDGRPVEEAPGPERQVDFNTFDSPDGVYKAVIQQDGESVVLENTRTGKNQLLTVKDVRDVLGWVPNSHTLIYQQFDSVFDKTKEREKKLRSLWLLNPDAEKLNTMCVALDSDERQQSWSPDAMKMLYICNDRLYVAELAWTEPDIAQKLAVGLPLSEEQEKALLLNNAKEIGIAIQLYWNDYDGDLPPTDNFDKVISDYLRNKNALCRPGTDHVIFTYTPPPGAAKESDIEYNADTVIGEMDAGYGWKVVVYADSHVKVVPKRD